MTTSSHKLDTFNKNILLVFAGSFLNNIFNLFYQLLLAYRLTPIDFAAFNSLLAIFMIISGAIGNLQPILTKYVAEFDVRGEREKSENLLSAFLKVTVFCGLLTFLLFFSFSSRLVQALKIECLSCGHILSFQLGLIWVVPVFMAGLQGRELFYWFAVSAAAGGVVKLLSVAWFLNVGYGVAGALYALVLGAVAWVILSWLPTRRMYRWKLPRFPGINFREITAYLLPVTASSLCFMALSSFDMVMVKYFFRPEDSGIYSLAQMIGKIFLFLPGAIVIVMFPRTAGLRAKNQETASTLARSLWYAFFLSLAALVFYNVFPGFVLRVLTGKSFPESIVLGRYFSVSMSFWTLLNILIAYFLSIKDLRFVKYLVIFTAVQFGAITLFHQTLRQVQGIVCLCAGILLCIHLILAFKKIPLAIKAAT